MSLWVEVYIGQRHNRKKVASAVAHNISNLADLSDYQVVKEEKGDGHLGIKPSIKEGKIEAHDRRSNVWMLVSKIGKM